MVDVGVDFGPDRGARNVGVSHRGETPGARIVGASPGETGGARKTGVPWTKVLMIYLTIIVYTRLKC